MLLSTWSDIVTLIISEVHKKYSIRQSKMVVNALNGINLQLTKGKTLGIVGESGCGKSTLARLIVGLETPTYGDITWNNEVLRRGSRNLWRNHRSPVQLVFQDPYSSLNPRQRIGDCIAEVVKSHKLRNRTEIDDRVAELLRVVGISPDMRLRYPHQLSGGQRQRVSIARALAAEPELLILDEPVSALDVSVRADVMNLLVDLKNEFGLTYVFISHDLSMVRHISDEIAVMYLGRVVEYGNWQKVLDEAKHPYTKALISSIPDHAQVGKMSLEVELEGEVPSPTNIPQGCAFHVRCPIAVSRCSIDIPPLIQISAQHQLACPEVSK
jgi:oligopeptide/dipeptide ABC transporter ATP-binding protein